VKVKVKAKVKEKGAALVEFALVAVIFFTVLLSIIEFGYLFWGNLSMQHAVREGSRYAVVTGLAVDPTKTPAQLKKERCDKVIKYTEDNSMGFYTRVAPVLTFTILNDSGGVDHVGSNPSDCGGSGDIVVIRIDCTLPLITPFSHLLSLIGTSIFTGGNYKFSVSTTMRNEAF
jgi:hypothetical protein